MAGHSTIYHKKYLKVTISLIIIIALCAGFSGSFLAGGLSGKTPAANAARGSSSIVMEATSLRVFAGENIHARLPMASTTKAMTALVIIEKCNLSSVVTIPKAAVGIEGSSIYLRQGEKLTVKELLYGLMLRSGNDAAVALAIHAGGSVEGFVKMMNDKARQLGLKNTNFTNPHGLHDPNHYTSAYDLAVISSVAIRNPVFKEICSTKRVRISGDSEESIRDLYNKNKILSMYSGGNGIKTGFTKDAGRCLIASSLRENMQVVAVVLNRGDMWEECMRLMDYAHANYCMQKVADSTSPVGEVKVNNGKLNGKYIYSAPVYVERDMYYPLKKDGSEKVSISVSIPRSIDAPHDKSVSLGKMEVTFDNRLIFCEKVYTMVNIEKKNLRDKLRDFFGIKHRISYRAA
ncbi:MAG TPA: D-alanyl-D-alanine carboxypeptidase family protein [Clostridia bacterium]|jgi:D-alanyl-D-alanine carboxypeptidase (penicillin-binding protein 5/6)|nr:D-alanyl-D-alanine carboxypeptidase family protein [Clostridia bacterium]HOL60742.1 D-alanyl-D-alanine carboxypeptidase family protein [Clostridia bacterium]HPO53317.1 D-alanyl-D-alanine carboxypeptidase family protein [Clostridia bacterium]